MSSFNYMGFDFDGGNAEMFVAHAKKYTANETINLFKAEYGFTIDIRKLREPSIADVQTAWCGYRFGVSSVYPHGCYTFVNEHEIGAFPVWFIDFRKLKEAPDGRTN